MRTLKITALGLAIAMLAMTGIALASAQFKQTAKVTLTATKPNQSSGVKAVILSEDPGAPFAQPQGLKVLKLTFPVKTKFNFHSKALAQCKASEPEIKATKGAACPVKSKLGTGSANANGAPVLPAIPEAVAAFAGNNEVILYLEHKALGGVDLILHAKVSSNKLTVEVPELKQGPVNIVLTELKLTIKAIGKGTNTFIKAGKCIKKRFVVTSSFLYQTGANSTLTSSSRCS
ncbi:MAG TPA: hypothetical protein VIC05_00150 [Solirubrobacteraceae bacterium]|jgi:hypothetical protein